jgi:hypothetical protein
MSGSMLTRVSHDRTILFIDLVNFTEQCALADAGDVGILVSNFYKHVEARYGIL